MARKPRPSKEKIYIKRDADKKIDKILYAKESKFIMIHAKGGIGKTTLLENYYNHEIINIPKLYISLKLDESTTFVNILLNDAITKSMNLKNFETIKNILLKEPKLLEMISSANTKGIESKIKELNEEWGEYAKIAIDTIKALAIWKNKKYEDRKKEILLNTEFVLLNALKEDLKEFSLIIIDTLEKYKEVNIKSKIKFNDGQIEMSIIEQNYRFKDYIEELFYCFDESTFLVAGRNELEELNFNMNKDDCLDLPLKPFITDNLKEFFKEHNEKFNLAMPSKKQLNQILELTNGNTLLISLFPEILKEYGSWEKLDYKEMKRRVENDKHFGLLFYMTDRILSHIDNTQGLWKVVIPRVLSQEIERDIFKNNILDNLLKLGLAKRGEGIEFNRYYLHDDVKSAIENYFKKEFKGNHSSWHDKEEVATLHQKLIVFYENNEIFGVNREFEKCYHTIMLKKNFEKEFKIDRKKFSFYLLGDISNSIAYKTKKCKEFNNLNKNELENMIKKYIEYEEHVLDYISKALLNESLKFVSQGKSKDKIYDINFLDSLRKKDTFKNDYSLYFVLGIAYGNKKDYDKAIEAYKKAIEINPENDSAYYNMGIAYGNKKDYDKAIEAYKKAIEINPENDSAYNNMGIAYYYKKDYGKAIEAYKKAIEINPENHVHLNLFGLHLIQNIPFNKELEKQFLKYFSDKKDIKIKYDMLKIFENISKGKDSGLEEWIKEYSSYNWNNWTFEPQKEWINGYKDNSIKAELLKALEVFEKYEA